MEGCTAWRVRIILHLWFCDVVATWRPLAKRTDDRLFHSKTLQDPPRHWRVENGKVREGWAVFDFPGLLKQLGKDFFEIARRPNQIPSLTAA